MTTQMIFEDVLAAPQLLSLEQKSVLFYRLQSQIEEAQYPLTRAQAQAELQALRRAGVFAQAQSLYGKYAHSSIYLDKEALHSAIREAATAWETELDEFPVSED